eukprot:8275-Heterococcus_DN1.PRE.2
MYELAEATNSFGEQLSGQCALLCILLGGLVLAPAASQCKKQSPLQAGSSKRGAQGSRRPLTLATLPPSSS